MSQLADFLETRFDVLLLRWIARVDATLAPGNPATRELAGQMPLFVRHVIATLRNPRAHVDGTAASPPGSEHGARHFRVGFDLDAVVREYGMLTHTLLDLIESAGLVVTIGEVRIVADRITAAIAEAASESARRLAGGAKAAATQESDKLGQLETTMLSIGDGVLATDARGHVTFMNPVAESLTGWSSEQARKKPLAEIFRIIDEHTRAMADSPVDRVLREGVVAGLAHHTLLVRDGSELPIDDSAAPIRDEKGQLSGVVLVFRDVSEKKKADEALARQARHAQLIAEVGQALTRIPDPRRMLQRCAEALVQQLGAAFARIWLLDEGAQALRLEASADLYTHLDGQQGRVPVGKLKIGLITKGGQPHLANAVVEDARAFDQEWAKREGMVAFAGHPLLVGDKLLGVVALFARNELASDSLDALRQVADSIALGVERLQAEQERERLLAATLAARAEAVAERQKLHALFEQTPVAICILEGPEHVFTFANPAYRMLAGGRQLEGKPLLQALPELASQGFGALLDRVMASGEVFFGNEAPVTLEHHEPLIMNFVYTPMRNAEGRASGVLVSVVDVTEQVLARKRVEVLAGQLGQSEERLRRVVEAAGAGIWELDVASGLVTADARHDALMGHPSGLETIHPEDRERTRRALKAAAGGENRGQLIIDFRTGTSDRQRWVELRGQLLFGEDGKPLRIAGTSFDVTGRKQAEAALAGEREKLETIFRESPAAMALWRGPELFFELANAQFERVFGNRKLVGKTLHEGLPELTGQPFASLLQQVLETGEPYVGHEVLARIASHEGGPLEDRYYDFTYLRVNDAGGKPYGVYDHSVDVTERVLARRSLEQSQERLRLALRGAQMGTWTILFPRGELISDEKFRQLHDVGETDDIQAAMDRDSHPEDRQRIREALAVAMKNGTPYACEYRVRGPQGVFHWIYARGEPKYDENKNPVSISGVAFDIDERKRNEAAREQLLQAFRSSEENFRTLAEAIPQQVWTALPNGALDFVNQRVVDYFAVPEESILGAGWQEVLHPEDLPASAKSWMHSLQTGEEYETELRLRRADGSYRWHLGRALSSRDAQGRIVKWFGTNTDIDEAKKLREELEKRTDFEQHLLGIVSHDLRNPLSAILIGAATLLQMEEQNERATRIARRIHSSAERSGRMIRDLLDFTQARLGAGIPLQRKPADLYMLTSMALDEIEAVAPDRVVFTRLGDAQGIWDVDRLSQVVTNLVGNSLKYSPPGTPVRVHVAGLEAAAELSVHNLGAPIPPERLQKIFEPLQRASDQIDRNDRSVGLGLYIVESIVRAHGGSVRVESTTDSGTTFTVRLPRPPN
jgi:PAS domain S-box-containing protein